MKFHLELNRIREGIRQNKYLEPDPVDLLTSRDEVRVKIRKALSEKERNQYRELEVMERTIKPKSISFVNFRSQQRWLYWEEQIMLGRKS